MRAKTLFGERLLGGGCAAPKNVSHGTNYESWGKSVAAVSGAHLVTADCGEPRNISNGTNFIFGSTATIAVEGDDANAPTASAGLFSAGAAASYLADGLVACQGRTRLVPGRRRSFMDQGLRQHHRQGQDDVRLALSRRVVR